MRLESIFSDDCKVESEVCDNHVKYHVNAPCCKFTVDYYEDTTFNLRVGSALVLSGYGVTRLAAALRPKNLLADWILCELK